MRRAITRTTAILIGWMLCEGLVRILVPGPIYYSTWFTPGVHQRDAELGFVFTPNYQGAMRHADRVWMQPLELNDHGFRLSARGGSDDGVRQTGTIVMLGGASMAFSFGLSDLESLHQQTASHLGAELNVHVVAWPGFTIGQDLLKLDRFMESLPIDRAIVFAYSEDDYQLCSELALPDIAASQLAIDNGDVLPRDPAARLVGAAYYRSVVLAGASRWWIAVVGLLKGTGAGETRSPAVAGELDTNTPRQQPAAFVAAQQLRARGIREVTVVALPHQLRQIGPDALERFTEDGVSVLDLRRLTERPDMDWIAGGHYGPRSAMIIGTRIASAIMLD